MAKNEYDDELELFADLEEEISTIILTDVDKEIRKIYKDKVDEMYESYDRTSYIPRYNKRGGFANEENWNSYIDKNKDSFEYILENETTGSMDDYGRRIDQIIETGEGYTWTRYPEARPVYEWTMQELEDRDVVEKTLEKRLKTKGWEVK